MRHTQFLTGLVFLGGLSLAIGGCGSDSTTSGTPKDGYGTLQVSVTDGPIDNAEISNLFITFDELYVVPTPDSLPPDSSDAPIHVLTSPVTLDLLALGNGLTTVLGAANLPEGNYRSINIKVDEGNSWLVEADGDTHDVKIPSERLKIVTDFTVTAGQVSDITLDFDAAASLHKTGNGTYILRPVIRQLPSSSLGASIAGTVLVQTDAGLVPAGQVMVANPLLGHQGEDHGNGNRPGDKKHGRGKDLRAQVPLTVAYPMLVHAHAQGDSSDEGDDDHDDGDDDGGGDDSTHDAAARLSVLGDDHGHEFPDGDPRFFGHHSRGTLVGLEGNYKLWRLRKDGTYELSLRLHPHSGYEVVSGPDPITLTADITGQNFVIRLKPSTP